jgi:hypothetical protein
MGEAKAIVGSHDLEPKLSNVVPLNGGGAEPTLLSLLTKATDGLDRAIQAKEKDLNLEGAAMLAENNLKLGRLKAADALIRQARAILQDYGAGLDDLESKDPAAWIVPGAIAAYDNGEQWVVDEVVGVGDVRMVKAHRQEFPAMKVELPILDFMEEFEE